MTEHYTAQAVNALLGYLESNLQAQLTLIEAASGLDAGDLPPPDAYVEGLVPNHPVSPCLQVWEEGFDAIEQRPGMFSVDCTVAIAFNGDADVLAGQLKIRRYASAIMWCILKAPTLSGAVVGCVFRGGERTGSVNKASETRHAYFLDWEVQVYERVP